MGERSIRDALPQLIFGSGVVLLGMLFLLDNLDIINAGRLLQYWFPGLFLMAGTIKLIQASTGGGKVAGLAFLLVGAVLLIDEMEVFDVSMWDLWPVILVIVGGTIIWRTLVHQTNSARTVADSVDRVSGVAILGGFKRSNGSRNFKGGNLTAFLGGCEVDLRDASISDSEAVIDVFAFWGGMEFRIPEDWVADVQIVPILGGVDDKTRPVRPDIIPKRLVIKGTVLMGGATLRN